MAYFRKRGKTWSFTIDGKERGGFRTKKEAEIAAAQMQVELDAGTFIPSSNISFKQYAMDIWLPIHARSVKASTLVIRKRTIKILVGALGEDVKLQDITPIWYEKIMLDLFDKYARNTALGINITAKIIFKKALNDGLIKIDPVARFSPPRAMATLEDEDKPPKYLEKDELARFLSTAEARGEKDYYLIFRLLAYTGMRIGELCALKWIDILVASSEISINKNCYIENSKVENYILTPPKTRASRRIIDIDAYTLKLLVDHRLQQRFYKSNCPSWHDADFVFTHHSRLGYPLYASMVGARMKTILKHTKLPDTLSPHSFRHTHCSLMAEAGSSLEEIQARLGQVDDKTTRVVYLHVTKARKKQTMQKFEQLMRGIF